VPDFRQYWTTEESAMLRCHAGIREPGLSLKKVYGFS
jgi:hypothetical protein